MFNAKKMNNFNINDSILGKEASHPERYDASLLFRIPREENRLNYNIDSLALPFVGVDVWNCYELSYLTNNGLPLNRVLKLIYTADSEYLVESKSLKLYLNSFNMEFLGETIVEADLLVKELIQQDLETLLQTKVDVLLFDETSEAMVPFQDFQHLTEFISEERLLNLNFTHFTETPTLLKVVNTELLHCCSFKSDLLRSNCRVTNQPDWGDLFVTMTAKCEVDLLSVIEYLVSFRKENHFHEEVVEMIFKRFMDKFKPERLMIAAMYTRRGGIDINPIRTTHEELIDAAFLSKNFRLAKTLRQ